MTLYTSHFWKNKNKALICLAQHQQRLLQIVCENYIWTSQRFQTKSCPSLLGPTKYSSVSWHQFGSATVVFQRVQLLERLYKSEMRLPKSMRKMFSQQKVKFNWSWEYIPKSYISDISSFHSPTQIFEERAVCWKTENNNFGSAAQIFHFVIRYLINCSFLLFLFWRFFSRISCSRITLILTFFNIFMLIHTTNVHSCFIFWDFCRLWASLKCFESSRFGVICNAKRKDFSRTTLSTKRKVIGSDEYTTFWAHFMPRINWYHCC